MSGRKWTAEEVAYLRAHRRDGARAIAEALGRSQRSVRGKASELGLSLLPSAWDRGELCPMCATREVERGTVAGRNGLCRTCWLKWKADTAREMAAEIRARREYDAARQDLSRARRGR